MKQIKEEYLGEKITKPVEELEVVELIITYTNMFSQPALKQLTTEGQLCRDWMGTKQLKEQRGSGQYWFGELYKQSGDAAVINEPL